MKNFYRILEVVESATQAGIKKAYFKLSLIHHPDKGGSAEAFKELTEAYNTLIDPVRRRQYDEALRVCRLAEEDIDLGPGAKPNWTPAGYIKTNRRAFSDTFKQQHAVFITEFDPKKTVFCEMRSCFDEKNRQPFSLFLAEFKKKEESTISVDKFKEEKLTPELSITLLLDFLKGTYTPFDIEIIKKQLAKKIAHQQTNVAMNRDISLHEGVIGILNSCLQHDATKSDLLEFIQKISNYAKAFAEYSDDAMLKIQRLLTAVFANKRYREMYVFALQCHFTSAANNLSVDDMQLFNGCKLAQKSLEKHKEDYINQENEQTLALLKLFGLIKKFETHNSEHPTEQVKDKSQFYRNKAYLTLDWVPGMTGLVDPSVLYNTLLQAGVSFQLASLHEANPAKRHADEKLAFHIYLNAWSLANKAAPDIELYINTLILKFVAQFRYIQDEKLPSIVSQIAQRTLKIADVYPFHTPCQSNMMFILDEGKSIILLRQFLHWLVKENEAHPDDKIHDHELVTVWYEVYNACLQNWYEKQIDLDVENSFRQKLMAELLRINRWTFADVNQLIIPSQVTVTRDRNGWMAPFGSLTFHGSERGEKYLSSVDAVEIDFETGQLTMSCQQYESLDSSRHKQLFTFADIEEIFAKRITNAIFSLDQADADMQHHPFNKIRFAPSYLYQSKLLHCMLLADYRLKFLTVGKEVQGNNPFNMRELDPMLKPLPAHLRRIIHNYQAHETEGAIHRFWIEAEELPIATEKDEKSGKLKIGFHQVRMVVKKHTMQRDTNGELIDKEHDEEGWDFFVGNPDLYHHDRPAMVWDPTTFEVIFYMDGQRSQAVVINKPKHLLNKLFKLSRDKDGKIIVKNSEEAYTLYSLTKAITKITSLPHYFSAEYCFAQEFTHYYNDFAMYFPELGRLRELSKIVMITRILCTKRESNFEHLNQVKSELNNVAFWDEIKAKLMPDVDKTVRDLIDKNRQLTKYDSLPTIIHNQLTELISKIGTLHFTQYSPEIKQLADENYEVNRSRIVAQHGYETWNGVASRIRNKIDSKMAEMAADLSRKKFESTLSQLRKLYSEELTGYEYSTVTSLLTDFLNNRPNRLKNFLLDATKAAIVENLRVEVFPEHSADTIRGALDNNSPSIDIIIEQIAQENIQKLKHKHRETYNKLERVEKAFAQMGLSKEPAEINLERVCLWVPASIKHDIKHRSSRTVYGGVQINGCVNQCNPALNNSTMSAVQTGTHVYRAWGGEARPFGNYWTTVNPSQVSNYRNTAGLPNCNAGTGLLRGTIVSSTSKHTTPAAPCDGNAGGLPQVIIENANEQIRLTFASYSSKYPMF